MTMNKVVWQEGMLLRPQHFQQNDRYHDFQLKARTRQLGLYSWGFFELEIDRQFLNMGKLVLSQARGILPDGSLFEIGAEREPLALDVPANTSNTPVYLALPLVTANHIESRRLEQKDVLARYVAHDEEVADSNAGDTRVSQVSTARPDFRLLLGEQDSDQAYVRLKLCDVLDTTPDGVISLDADYIPTYIDFQASGYLLSCLKEVISMLAHRGDILAERIRATGKVGGAEVGDFMMLQLINRYEPVLRHYLGLERVHPEQIYRELLGLLGELATFSSETKRPRLDGRYLHGDQGQSFRRLMDAIRQVLSMVLEQHAIEMLLQQRQYGIQVSPLHDHKLLGSASFVLAASAQCDSEELRQRLPAHLKVGPVERIRQLVNLHLPGIRVRPLPVAPRQIPFHSGKTYFALELSSEELAQLERSGGFAFHVSGEFSGLELKFWAIRN
ncbi:type VI secretion system baseplate subunit TssK [Stutzerimonas balearica]|jgi:type VI secretion system protein ImpJ|uniref:Type VI secretion system baseplate subunit TssK n=1 Tax=Stutzerimonas balearica TaxID=74829 RepID=A0A9X7V037_9GAMM|nr:type VI secretion system baseplate subunit TssK [Stutzerimonas balearica]QQN49528.1 type VI secretion system baseplate subunit TssK [Stutzerimonas balearica]HAV87372.1 type VI secretion system baseplate subunit TssK [Pseudomonas sp.]